MMIVNIPNKCVFDKRNTCKIFRHVDVYHVCNLKSYRKRKTHHSLSQANNKKKSEIIRNKKREYRFFFSNCHTMLTRNFELYFFHIFLVWIFYYLLFFRFFFFFCVFHFSLFQQNRLHAISHFNTVVESLFIHIGRQ